MQFPKIKKFENTFIFSEEAVIEILTENGTTMPLGVPLVIDVIPEELSPGMEITKMDPKQVFCHHIFDKIETKSILEKFEGNKFNVYEAIVMVKWLFNEISVENYNEMGIIIEVLFKNNGEDWSVVVFRNNNTELICPNRLNIRWQKIVAPFSNDPVEKKYGMKHAKPYTVKGTIVCL